MVDMPGTRSLLGVGMSRGWVCLEWVCPGGGYPTPATPTLNEPEETDWKFTQAMETDGFILVGVSRGYTDYYQGRGHSSRPTAALINIHEPLI